MAPAYAEAVERCMLGLGDPMGCLSSAVGQTPSSAELSEFATTFCLECGGGAGPCEGEVQDGTASSDAARAGRLARTLDIAVLDEVTRQCATGDDCEAGFYDCAVDILSRSLPDETAACMGEAVVLGAPDEVDCSGTGGDDVADVGQDSDTGGTADDNGDDNDTGDDATDDGMLDDSGECSEAGCACMFTEDCDAGLTCNGDFCIEPTECEPDDNEPNGDEDTATFLPPIGDSDEPGSQLSALLDHPTDVDWFRYEGADNVGAFVNPYAQVNVVALEVCIYAECTNGLENTDLTCPKGTTQSPSPGGRPGCCAANTMGFELDLSCTVNPFGSDDATVYMSVTGSEPSICQEYTLSYHY